MACAGALWAWSGCDSSDTEDGGGTSTSGGATTGGSTGGSSSGGSTTGASSGTGGTTGGATSGTTSGGSTTGGSGTTGGTGGVSCQLPGTSSCGNPASIVRGVAQLAPGFDPPAGTKGTLAVFLTHVYLGDGPSGGVFHTASYITGVDLSKGPVPFQIDMCTGGMMYSEDNCDFNLIAILDTNGNNSDINSPNYLPDVGEATSKQVIKVSCRGGSQCLTASLGCGSGTSCVAFTDPSNACRCDPQTCNSDITTCQ